MDIKKINSIAELYSKNPPSVNEASRFQRQLSSMVINKNSFNEIKTVAGADLAILTQQKKLVCVIVVFKYPELEEIERVWSVVDEKFPYIPGLLAFREGPAIIETYKKIQNKPDILILDGQGIAHPRNFGIACYVGVLLDISTFGIGKKKLYGLYKEPDNIRGSLARLKHNSNKNTIGAVVRTKDNVKPVFVSIGNKVELKTAIQVTLNCDRGYRLPEPTRLADRYVSELKKEIGV